MKLPALHASLLATTASLLAVVAPTQVLADIVGTAGAANVLSTGKLPGGGERTIEIGTQIVHNERIETSSAGSVHIIFIDKTTLNIGPNSSVVINDYVYNPAEGTGRMSLSLARGIMRIVGGQVTHTGGAEVKTPVATMGLRGGISTVRHCATSGGASCPPGTRIINHFGRVHIHADGGDEDIMRPGFGSFVGWDTNSPAPPSRVSQGEIDGMNFHLTSAPQQHGGINHGPNDQQARNAGLGGSNNGINPFGAPQQPQTGSGSNTQNPPNVDNFDTIGQQSNQQSQTAHIPPSPKAFMMTTTAGAGSAVPFLTASFVASGKMNAGANNIYGFQFENAPASAVMQAGLVIDGTGPNQKSTLSAMMGIIKASGGPNDPYVLTGQVYASSRLNASGQPIFGSSSVSSTSNAVLTAASETGPGRRIARSRGVLSPVPVDRTNNLVTVPSGSDLPPGDYARAVPTGSFSISQNTLPALAGAVTETSTPGYNAGSSFGYNYKFDQTVTPAQTPDALGADNSKTFALAGGFVGGLARTTTSGRDRDDTRTGSVYVVTNQTGNPGDVSIAALPASIPGLPPGASAPGVQANFRIALGRKDLSVDMTGPMIDSRIFAMEGSGTQGHRKRITYNTLLVSSDAVQASSFFPNVSFCDCAYTRWGFWSLEAEQSSRRHVSTDLGHLMLWVAGKPTAAGDIPLTGSASYSGHVIANLAQNNAQYIAASNMTMLANFGSRTGQMTVQNLDGFSYSGGGALFTNGPTQFQMNLAGTALSGAPTGITPNMSVNAAFMAGITSPYGEIAGNVTIGSPVGQNYLGGGILAGKKL